MPISGRSGSSPHTRGAPPQNHAGRRRRRIIPAYAGSTRTVSPTCPKPADHPRIRGEHSPTTKGMTPKGRIIPAYAGSTHPDRRVRAVTRDHPRIRGEHHLHARSWLPGNGSSPHTRGARRHAPPRRRRRWDHPRIRGEHRKYQQDKAWRSGSSPHTRGARELGLRVPRASGIIPAYAGSTSSSTAPPRRRSDHPRIRGEHSLPAPSGLRPGGSSPHTRGALCLSISFGSDPRIIPAYAGSTSAYKIGTMKAAGSSPHTRGARCPFLGPVGRDGIIPAYAGSTQA